MTPALPTLRQPTVPEFGRIVGGLLDGWEFTLLSVGVEDGQAFVAVRAHAPHWPFPSSRVTRLFNNDFTKLHGGDHRARQRDTHTMIKAAMAAEGAPA